MTTQTAPSKDEIAALTGSDLTDAIADACIDWKTGGSRSDGSLTADEARNALQEHYHGDPPVLGAPGEPDGSEHARPDDGEPEQGDGAAGAPADDGDSRPESIEEQREKQLAAGQATGELKAAAERKKDWTAAEHRAGVAGARPNEGRVDNMTRRTDADALQGHFCIIDFGDEEFGDEAKRAVERIIGEGNARAGSGDYGVYTEPGELDETGYPLTANVLLRDEHSALVSGVPYRALRTVLAGGRR